RREAGGGQGAAAPDGREGADRQNAARRLRRHDRRRRAALSGDAMDIKALMKQAQKMQEKLQKEIAELKVEATSGGGMVTVTMSGSHELLSVRISPEVVKSQDVEMLEDLVRAAVNEARRKIEEAMSEKVGALRVPGL